MFCPCVRRSNRVRVQKKYLSEAAVTRNHLHVMALERVTFAKIGLASELQFMDRDYRINSSPEYKRAWEIVVDIEGERAFLKEFQLLAAGK